MRSKKLGMTLAVVSAALSVWLPVTASASTVGDPIEPEFNHVGLYLGTSIAGDVDALVLKPPAAPAVVHGTYTDGEGNFTVPESGGFDFPELPVDLGGFSIEGDLELAGPGSGKYDEATGAMTMDLDLALTLGSDDISEVGSELGIDLGSGQLTCRLSPLAVEFDTAGDFPHPGKNFEDPAGLIDGALAGVWKSKPPATAVAGSQDVCNLVAGMLKPVGGLWFANSSTPIESMPPWDPPECPPVPLSSYLTCIPPDPPGPCSFGPQPCVGGKGEAADLSISPGRATVRPGRSKRFAVTLRNIGNEPLETKLNLRSSNAKVRLGRSLAVTVPAGGTLSRKIVVKAGGRARGRARITVRTSGLSAGAVLVVRGSAKRR